MKCRIVALIAVMLLLFPSVVYPEEEKKIIIVKKLPSVSQQRRELTTILNRWTRFHWDVDFSLYVIYYSPEVIDPWVRFKQILNKWDEEKTEKFKEGLIQQLRIGRAAAFLITVINSSYKPVLLRPLSKRLMLVYGSNIVFPVYYESQLDSPITGIVQGLVFFPPIPKGVSSFSLRFADLPEKGESIELKWATAVIERPEPPVRKQPKREEIRESVKTKPEVSESPEKITKEEKPKVSKVLTKKPSVKESKTENTKASKKSKAQKGKPKVTKVTKKPSIKKSKPKITKVPQKPVIKKKAPVPKVVYEYKKPVELKLGVATAVKKPPVKKSPSEVARSFLQAWIKGDYNKMYELLSNSTKKRLRLSEFKAKLLSLHVDKSFLSGLRFVREDTKGDSSRVIFKFTSSLLFVKISKLKVFHLIREDGRWGIVWQD